MDNNQDAPYNLPVELTRAANAGDSELVLRWLENGGDVNARCPDDAGGGGDTLLNCCIAHIQPVTYRHVALARELVARGANPNIPEWDIYGGRGPIHYVLKRAGDPPDIPGGLDIMQGGQVIQFGQVPPRRLNPPTPEIALEMFDVLLKAPGANVDLRTDFGTTPLCVAIGGASYGDRGFLRGIPFASRRAFVTKLLRAGASLDACQCDPGGGNEFPQTAEQVLEGIKSRYELRIPADQIEAVEAEQAAAPNPHFRRIGPGVYSRLSAEEEAHWNEIKALVDGVRRDGYFRYFKLNVPMCKDVLLLRSLALRGRATTASPVLQFVIDSPNEIAWNVLSFWRASC